MIESYEAFIKRVKIDNTFFIVPIEVEKKLRELEDENEKLKAEVIQMNAQKDADDFETAKKIIVNLMSDRMGMYPVLTKTDINIFDEFWAELEGRIINALNNRTVNGTELRPDMLHGISKADEEELLRSRRSLSLKHDKGIEKSALTDPDSDDPKEKRRKRREVIRID